MINGLELTTFLTCRILSLVVTQQVQLYIAVYFATV